MYILHERGFPDLSQEPHAAQGYSMIVEDIGVLQYLISRNANPKKSLPEILETWERLRKPRAERIKAYAKHNGASFLSSIPFPTIRPARSAPASKGRDALPAKSLKDVRPDMNAKFESAAFLKWALDYDAVAEVRYGFFQHAKRTSTDRILSFQAKKYLESKPSRL